MYHTSINLFIIYRSALAHYAFYPDEVNQEYSGYLRHEFGSQHDQYPGEPHTIPFFNAWYLQDNALLLALNSMNRHMDHLNHDLNCVISLHSHGDNGLLNWNHRSFATTAILNALSNAPSYLRIVFLVACESLLNFDNASYNHDFYLVGFRSIVFVNFADRFLAHFMYHYGYHPEDSIENHLEYAFIHTPSISRQEVIVIRPRQTYQ